MRFRSIDKLCSRLPVYVNHARARSLLCPLVSSLFLLLYLSFPFCYYRLRCFRLFVFVSSQAETHPCASPRVGCIRMIGVTRIVFAAFHCSGRTSREYRLPNADDHEPCSRMLENSRWMEEREASLLTRALRALRNETLTHPCVLCERCACTHRRTKGAREPFNEEDVSNVCCIITD